MDESFVMFRKRQYRRDEIARNIYISYKFYNAGSHIYTALIHITYKGYIDIEHVH